MPLRGRSFRGFPFDEEEGSGAWSELAARHPDIAARLRQRPATWARKRRPSSQDATDDFGESFSGFDRFPFDDIPPEFREHFPSRWNRRFSDRDQPPPESAPPPQSRSPPAHHHTAATQTERDDEQEQEHTLPQYGLRNTVDLGQRSAADPSVDADERSPRSMSAPPDAPRTVHPNMSAPNHHPGAAPPPHHDQHPTVRHIPIFVEGRDEPVINRSVDHGTHFGETKPAYQPPPPAPPVDREQYFADDGPAFHHPANFTRAFGTPFNKGFRQGPQPFTQQKAYPQGAFARAASPQRSQSPRPHPPQEEHYVKVPVHHEPAPPRAEPPSRAQQKPPPPRQPSPPPSQQQREPTPPKPQQSPSDPITQILSIQTDVLNLMTEVENFKGTKKDKRYLFLDEMLTRNLIKLDNIETEGKENIRQARREAIRCIEKCIAVLEAKADSNSAKMAETQDVEMKENNESTAEPELVTENGEVEMKEAPKEENVAQPERTDEAQAPKEEVKEETKREETPKPQETTKPEDTPKAQETPKREETPKPQETPKSEETPKQQEKPEETVKPQEEQTQKPQTEVALENTESQIPSTDTRPEETKPEEKTDEQKKKVENKPKKKVVKKRDKSKEASKESNTEEAPKDNTNSNKTEAAEAGVNVEAMQVDDKGDKPMEVDGAASQ